MTFGAGYHAPRVDGTRNVLDASADLIFNRYSGAAEGSFGELLAYQPLYSARTPWAWDSVVQMGRADLSSLRERGRKRVPRDARRGDRQRPLGVQDAPVLCAGVAQPIFGVGREKHDLSVGAFVDLRDYSPTTALAAYDPRGGERVRHRERAPEAITATARSCSTTGT